MICIFLKKICCQKSGSKIWKWKRPQVKKSSNIEYVSSFLCEKILKVQTSQNDLENVAQELRIPVTKFDKQLAEIERIQKDVTFIS
eukprot:UN02870